MNARSENSAWEPLASVSPFSARSEITGGTAGRSSGQGAMPGLVSRGPEGQLRRRGSAVPGRVWGLPQWPAVGTGREGGADGISGARGPEPFVCFQPGLELGTSLLRSFWRGRRAPRAGLDHLCALASRTRVLLRKATAQGRSTSAAVQDAATASYPAVLSAMGRGPLRVVLPRLSLLPQPKSIL